MGGIPSGRKSSKLFAAGGTNHKIAEKAIFVAFVIRGNYSSAYATS
jgi:hypothetical protein